MNAFLAIMVDAYRELNSRKLFWITMVLSGGVVLAFLALGINAEGLRIFGWTLEIPGINTNLMTEETFFKSVVFIGLGLGVWLTWVATILALCTTAGMFPDLMSGGAIDMVLSKPIRRSTLFIYKYLAGLLFTALQVAVFTGLSFVLIGVKTGAWEPGLFLAVPVVTLFYSYLFSVCVLLGVLTRSTVAALLLTLLFWFVVFIANAVDSNLTMFNAMAEQRFDNAVQRIETEERIQSDLEARLADDPENERLGERLEASRQRLENFTTSRDDAAGSRDGLAPWRTGVFAAKTALPKTGETIELLNRWLVDAADLNGGMERDGEVGPLVDENGEPIPGAMMDPDRFDPDDTDLGRRIREDYESRSVAWVIGTSLLFEAVILFIAGIAFVRRDF